MPRRNWPKDRRPRDEPEEPLSPQELVAAPRGWQARTVHPPAARKVYTCPWCHRDVAIGTLHIVAWPDGNESWRRHFHGACWRAAARSGRIPT